MNIDDIYGTWCEKSHFGEVFNIEPRGVKSDGILNRFYVFGVCGGWLM